MTTLKMADETAKMREAGRIVAAEGGCGTNGWGTAE